MDEEIDTRKINNSFLRDHNYATEGISSSHDHLRCTNGIYLEISITAVCFIQADGGEFLFVLMQMRISEHLRLFCASFLN